MRKFVFFIFVSQRYVFFYKKSRMQFVEGYSHVDTKDVFQFEPYVAHFNSSHMSDLTDFVIIPLHAKPSGAVAEIDGLVDVYDKMVEKWNIEGNYCLTYYHLHK